MLVGDRGMITQARLREDVVPAKLDWITALRAPDIKALAEGGQLQLSLFDERNMAVITSPDFPGERLIVCRNPDLAAERRRKRNDLLTATQRDLTAIKQRVERKRAPLRGADKIGMTVGAVLNRHKMAKHFDIEIADDRFAFARKEAEIAAEAACDGIYVIRTNLSADAMGDPQIVASYKSLSRVERAFRSIKTVDLEVVRRPLPSNVPALPMRRIGGLLCLDLLQHGRQPFVVDDRAGLHRLDLVEHSETEGRSIELNREPPVRVVHDLHLLAHQPTGQRRRV